MSGTPATFAVDKAYLRTPLGQVHWRGCGDDRGRPLLLLHQSPSSSAMWEPVLPLFALSGFRSIALDMPGYGESYRPARPPHLSDYAEAVLVAVEALGLASVDVVGHHTGAAVALQAAVDAPSAIRRIVAWGIPLLDDALQRRLATEPVPEYDDQGDAIRACWARRRSLSGSAYRVDVGIRCALEMLQTGLTRPWGHWAVAAADMEDLLGRVAQPTLVLSGEEDPVWVRSRESAARLPRGSFARIDGAGLDVVDQHPQRFVELVARFLS